MIGFSFIISMEACQKFIRSLLLLFSESITLETLDPKSVRSPFTGGISESKNPITKTPTIGMPIL